MNDYKEIKEKTFRSANDASRALQEAGLKFYGKTPDKRNKRNFNIFTDSAAGIDYHVSYSVVENGVQVSLQDVTDKL